MVLAALAVVAVVAMTAPHTDFGRIAIGGGASVHGVLQATGLLFFAFAGYARIATLGEEVRDPARTIPRAIPVALGIALIVYAVVAVALLAVLGSPQLAQSAAPIADAVRAAGVAGCEPVVRAVAVLAALGSLLSLILGVSRTTFAMARDHYLPQQLSAVQPRFKTPYRAEIAVGLVVAVLAGTADVRSAIGFSSFAVLVYYAIANASAWTLGGRMVPTLGFIGCIVIALALPLNSVILGTAVLLAGAAVYALRRGRSSLKDAWLEEESGVWCFTNREQPLGRRERCRIVRVGQLRRRPDCAMSRRRATRPQGRPRQREAAGRRSVCSAPSPVIATVIELSGSSGSSTATMTSPSPSYCRADNAFSTSTMRNHVSSWVAVTRAARRSSSSHGSGSSTGSIQNTTRSMRSSPRRNRNSPR